MGKGGTRFVSDAVAVRSGRQRSSFSARELRRDMDAYCETGVHPDIERAVQQHVDYPAEKPLPPFRHDRPFVYFDFSIAKEPIGRSTLFGVKIADVVCVRVTVELFEEHNPRGAEILKNRCRAGSRQSFMKTRVHKLLTDCAFFIGKPRFGPLVYSRSHQCSC